MKTKRLLFSLALVAAVVVALLVGFRPSASLAYGIFLALAGTVTYAYPVAGATAPTAVQSATASVVTATIAMADGDSSVAVVHNWGLTAAQLAALFPFIELRRTAQGATPIVTLAVATDGNTVTISKGTAAGSAFTGVVVIQRPHSILAQVPKIGSV
jgi:hypothetical protein